MAWPLSIASISSASVPASLSAAARSGLPGLDGDMASTAAVPATEASHQPASRSGTMLIVPGEAAGST